MAPQQRLRPFLYLVWVPSSRIITCEHDAHEAMHGSREYAAPLGAAMSLTARDHACKHRSCAIAINQLSFGPARFPASFPPVTLQCETALLRQPLCNRIHPSTGGSICSRLYL